MSRRSSDTEPDTDSDSDSDSGRRGVICVLSGPLARTNRANFRCHDSCAGGGHDNTQITQVASSSRQYASGRSATGSFGSRNLTVRYGPCGPTSARCDFHLSQPQRRQRKPRRQSQEAFLPRSRLHTRSARSTRSGRSVGLHQERRTSRSRAGHHRCDDLETDRVPVTRIWIRLRIGIHVRVRFRVRVRVRIRVRVRFRVRVGVRVRLGIRPTSVEVGDASSRQRGRCSE